jgi:hypothetical protein
MLLTPGEMAQVIDRIGLDYSPSLKATRTSHDMIKESKKRERCDSFWPASSESYS